jgi:hypothetical protein
MSIACLLFSFSDADGLVQELQNCLAGSVQLVGISGGRPLRNRRNGTPDSDSCARMSSPPMGISLLLNRLHRLHWQPFYFLLTISL